MLKQKTYKTHKRFDVEQEANRTSGDRYFIDDFPSREPNIGMWDIDTGSEGGWIVGAENIAIGIGVAGIVCTVNVCTGIGDARSLSIEQSPTVALNQEEQKNLISDLPEKEDPFTQADILDTEDYQVQDLILRFRTLPFITYHERLVKRLFTLFNDAREEGPVSLGISVGSLRNFYNFLYLHTNLKCPAISLTPEDNNIYASWSEGQGKTFSVLFLPNGVDARFVILKPNDKYPEQQITFSGLVTTDILIENVKPYGILDWITDER